MVNTEPYVIVDKTTGKSCRWCTKDKSDVLPDGSYKHQRPAKACWITTDIMSAVQDKLGISADTIDHNVVVMKAINGFYGLNLDMDSVNRSPDARTQKPEVAKTDNSDLVAGLKKFIADNKVSNKAVFQWILENRDDGNGHKLYDQKVVTEYLKLYDEHIATKPAVVESFGLPKLF